MSLLLTVLIKSFPSGNAKVTSHAVLNLELNINVNDQKASENNQNHA